jgi:S-adenosylmethionine:tRNA ribosyltransferase-isomerase
VIAVGTSVVRALEAAYLRGAGSLQAGEAEATLRITPEHKPHVVDGLLTGIHSPEESHFELLGAFMDKHC